MSKRFKNLKGKTKNQAGFTLIEMLIVIIVLGILAMVIVPQITVSTEDAKVNTLKTNLSGVRSAIETYYAQHENKYPGELKIDGATSPSEAESLTATVQQLTRYTSSKGVVSDTKDTTTYKYGPYLRGTGSGGFPNNPFTETNTLATDHDETNITTRDRSVAGTEAWMYYPKTGVFIANDSDAHAAY